jgi:hypothetical protein
MSMLFFLFSLSFAEPSLQQSKAIKTVTFNPPASLSGIHKGTTIELSWSPIKTSQQPQELGYLIFRSPAPNGPWQQQSPSLPHTQATFIDKEIASAQNYWYRIATVPLELPTQKPELLWDALLNFGSLSSVVEIKAPPAPLPSESQPPLIPILCGFLFVGAGFWYTQHHSKKSSAP